MKTVTEFKSKLKQPGVEVKTTYHMAFAGRDENLKPIYKDKDMGVRRVATVRSNDFALLTDKNGDGNFAPSWCAFPKKNEVIFNEKGITILTPDLRQHPGGDMNKGQEDLPKIAILTYEFVN